MNSFLNFFSYMLLPEDISKQSTCELEVDCLQSEILNKEYIKGF